MFENLNGTTAILTSQINPYFIKYSPAILPEVDDVAIVKWTEIISQQTDLSGLLITKMASRLLSVPELTVNSPSVVNSKLSPSSVTSRADECFIYRDSIYAKYGLLNTK
jgi:hypothetical protein